MVSAEAMRPEDILNASNGKTIEVLLYTRSCREKTHDLAVGGIHDLTVGGIIIHTKVTFPPSWKQILRADNLHVSGVRAQGVGCGE